MGQPIKLSNELVQDARVTGELLERSIAGQVEFWARLGRSVDRLLGGDQVLRLSKQSRTISLSECFESIDAPAGQQRLQTVLENRPYPHFQAVPGSPDLVERIEADGTRTIGKFVNRQFQASAPKLPQVRIHGVKPSRNSTPKPRPAAKHSK